jgi:hypothetical protein
MDLFTMKPTDALISKFILVRNSTCFGHFLCLSSGVFHCTFGTVTCYTGLTTACVQDQGGTAILPWSCTFFPPLNHRSAYVPHSFIRLPKISVWPLGSVVTQDILIPLMVTNLQFAKDSTQQYIQYIATTWLLLRTVQQPYTSLLASIKQPKPSAANHQISFS